MFLGQEQLNTLEKEYFKKEKKEKLLTAIFTVANFLHSLIENSNKQELQITEACFGISLYILCSFDWGIFTKELPKQELASVLNFIGYIINKFDCKNGCIFLFS